MYYCTENNNALLLVHGFFELEAFYILSQNLHFARTQIKYTLVLSLKPAYCRLKQTGATLDRGTRQVRLTEEGRQFARFARESIHQKASLLSGFAVSDDAVSEHSVYVCHSLLFNSSLFIENIGKVSKNSSFCRNRRSSRCIRCP